MQDIHAWLHGDREFYAGIELYEKYGSNGFFLRLLHSDGPTNYNIEKLESELECLAPPLTATFDTTRPLIPDRAQLPKTEAGFDDHPITDPVDLRHYARYLALKELKKNKYRQLDHNMAALGMSNDQTFLHLTAKQILSLHEQISDIYKLLDHYDDFGHFPEIEVKEEIIRTPEEAIQLLWQSNSRAKSRLATGKCRNVAKTEQLIVENNKRIADLKERLEQ
jgi:hypothetical protein